jgi:hypothetical protein
VRLWTDGTIGEPDLFTLTEPHALVIGLPGVAGEGVRADLRGSGPHVERIRVVENPSGAQVVLEAPDQAALADRRILPMADGLLVTLGRGETATRALAEADGGEPARVDPPARVSAGPDPAEQEADTLPRKTLPEPPESLPTPGAASRLVSVEVVDTADGALVRLRADGPLVSRRWFLLRDPFRLVIDLPGLEFSGGEEAEFPGSSLFVDRVRLGHNRERIRIVIDAPEEDRLVERRFVWLPDGLVVMLGRGETVTRMLRQLEGAGR